MIAIPLLAQGGLPLIEVGVDLQAWNTPKYGVLHWPSLAFIGFSWLLLSKAYRKNAISIGERNSRRFTRMITEAGDYFSKHYHLKLKGDYNDEHYRMLIDKSEQTSLESQTLNVIMHGGSDDDIKRLVYVESLAVRESLLRKSKQVGFTSSLLPLLGMAGTITGLMFIFSGDISGVASAEESFDQKFTGMGIALLTTLYATLATSIMVKPRLQSLQQQLIDIELLTEQLEASILLFKHNLDMSKLLMIRAELLNQQRAASLSDVSDEKSAA
ncbi:MotA/TolQ/ExbB proton channel family protein [Vibrio sp. WXL210]|uniref:MotA/TolQ/ExbB proton channel family protein n=1 Tax=Vibrio sp. WXL210 TaxID=3450709 RepID=UPI003EC4C53A